MHAPVQTANVNTANAPELTPLPLRAHTILGVCEALGEDFGISPMWLRIPLAASVLVSPLWSVVAYLALGLVVLGSRLAFPARRRLVSAGTAPAAPAPNAKADELPLAA